MDDSIPQDIPQSKRCTHCKEIKPFNSFTPSKVRSDGRSSWCKACHAAVKLAKLHAQKAAAAKIEKVCSQCGNTKPLTEFYKNKAESDGYCAYCIPCYKHLDSLRRVKENSVGEGLKRCTHCGEVKPLSNFYKGHGMCKICSDGAHRKRQRERDHVIYSDTKQCIECGKIKPLTGFHRMKRNIDGYEIRCRSCKVEYARLHTRPRSSRKDNLKRSYHMTEEHYIEMFLAQHGVCACCGNEETAFDVTINAFRPLSIDHCHETKKVRGLLCGKCNTALGFLQEDPERIRALLKYAEYCQSLKGCIG